MYPAASWLAPVPMVSSARRMFSPEEDERLKMLVGKFGENNWKNIARQMPNRTTRQCRERYKNYLSPHLSNAVWTQEEDELLAQKFAEIGPKWAKIAGFFQGRSDVNVKNHWTTLCSRKNHQHIEPLTSTQAPTTKHAESEGTEISPAPNPVPEGVNVVSAIATMKPDELPPLIVKDKSRSETSIGNLAQLLWGPQGRKFEESVLRRDNVGLEETFPGYGGNIW